MYHDFTYRKVLATSLRAQWELDDVLPPGQDLDFSRDFMPHALARTATAPGLSPAEKRTLNHICAHQYLHYFGVVEQFVLPFVLDHARPMLNQDDYRVRALLNFASEEAKHVQLFRRYTAAFARGFPVKCVMVGPPEQLQKQVLSHHPLAVGLIVLMIEWMTQAHYLGCVRDNGDLDPLFKSLLRHHWMEEAQHAKLDTLIVDALAEGMSEREFGPVLDEFFAIASYLDASIKVQAQLNLDALQRAIGRQVPEPAPLVAHLYRAARWTYLGSAMTHPRFRATLNAISPAAAARVADAVAQSGMRPAARLVQPAAALA